MNIILNTYSSLIEYGMRDKSLIAKKPSEHATGLSIHRNGPVVIAGLSQATEAERKTQLMLTMQTETIAVLDKLNCNIGAKKRRRLWAASAFDFLINVISLPSEATH